MSVDVKLEGLGALHVNFDKVAARSLDAAMQGLSRAGLDIIAAAKENLRSNTSVVTGQLRASGRVQKVQDAPNTIDVGFFSNNTANGYAYFVEHGRRAGKVPPPSIIAQWLRKKHRVPDKEAESRGFALARKIAKKGTQAHPFFEPAVNENKSKIEQAVSEAVRREL